MRLLSLRLTLTTLALPALLIAGIAVGQVPDQPFPGTPPAPTEQPSIEQDPVEQAPVKTAERPRDLDGMLAALKRERSPQIARQLANSVMAKWNTSQSPTVDLLLEWAKKATEEKRTAAALDFLDQAIALNPDFVGAWNQRATLHYTMGNYKKSVSDINKVLELEPRHFGALAGLAAILSERGSQEAALKAWERYVEIYPADREAQEFVITISEELAGTRT
ncbi:tetratricopeptide repeat protein [Rhizobium sp. SL42]|uniref:tetratricopeptide repeat protein n=1 Tax=Rhizobium sp. SL42 TaxID=2806346 RepID=UPI001F25D266|nr:hypothetical protein [Rhizobium sp. SL42]UJW74611.1 hypothetical protein IM739_17370 [Rhizobium sp. SL42]